MENEIAFCIVVGFWMLIALLAGSILYGIGLLLIKFADSVKEKWRRQERINYYTELMYEDWRQHPEHAQGRKLPEEK